MDTTFSFGYWVHRRRKALDLTQARLAERVGCAPVTIKKIERDERRPSLQVAELLANALAVPAEERNLFLQAALGQKPMDALTLVSRPVQPSVPLHNLPAQPTPFIGREAKLERLNQLLARPDRRLITITGIGGIGKTRLALAAAGQQLTTRPGHSPFPHGIYFISLVPLHEANQVLPRLAQVLRFPLQADDRRSPQEQVFDFLHRKRMLLVFDNFEHVLEAASLVADLLQAAPHVKVLATSREPLQLYEEQLFSLDGLAFSAELITKEDAAVQLFVQRAEYVRPDFALQAADLPAMTAICDQVEGMPLGLELAAAWVKTLPLADIAEELSQSLDLLETDWRNVPDRHRSMRAVFDVSWQRLGDKEQRVFSQLSVFRDGFTRQAAWQVCAPEWSQQMLRRLLALLAGKSFLRYSPTLDRYDLHELLRQYAAEKLAQMPEVETAAIRERHSAYYSAFLSEYAKHWRTGRQLETLAAVTRELDNVERALRWAIEQAEWPRLVQAIHSWRHYSLWQGRFTDDAFCQAIVEKAETQAAGATAVSPDCLRLWATALAWHADSLEPGMALQELEQSLALLERPELAGQDTRPEKAFTLYGQASIVALSDREEARRYYEQGLALYQELGDLASIADGLVELGTLDWHVGNYAAALDRLQAGLVIQQELGHQYGQIGSLVVLGLIHQHLGHLGEAEQLHRQALSLAQQLGDKAGLIAYRRHLAYTLLWQGQLVEAQQLAQDSLTICRDLGLRNLEVPMHFTIASLLIHTGHYQEAHQQATHGLPLSREFGSRNYEGSLYYLLGQLALIETAFAEAQAAFAESISIFRELQQNVIGIPLAGLGYVASRLGHFPQARRHLAEALASALAIKAYMPLVFTLPGVALLLAATRTEPRAVEIWALAERQPLVTKSKWFEDVAGQELKAVAASLPPEAAEAAKERSRMLDLWQTAEGLLNELE